VAAAKHRLRPDRLVIPRRTLSWLVKLRAVARHTNLAKPALTVLVEQRSASPGAVRCGTPWLWPGAPLIAVLQTRGPGDLAERKDHGRAILPVWKGLVDAGAAYGGPEVLTWIEAPAPDAVPGQVWIVVRAASVNPIEWKRLAGAMSGGQPLAGPEYLGNDAAGVVHEVGEGVTGVSVGDDVFRYGQGTQSEPAVLDAWAAKPPPIDWAVAAVAGETGARSHPGPWAALPKVEQLSITMARCLPNFAADGPRSTCCAGS
jgi:hypothetical protein